MAGVDPDELQRRFEPGANSAAIRQKVICSRLQSVVYVDGADLARPQGASCVKQGCRVSASTEGDRQRRMQRRAVGIQ
jgi:hypothetical protein